MATATVSIGRRRPIVKNVVREKVPNTVFQAAIDECNAMVRGDIPMPSRQTVAEIFAELKAETCANTI